MKAVLACIAVTVLAIPCLAIAAVVGAASQAAKLISCQTTGGPHLISAPAADAPGLSQFLAAVRTHESGGNYQAHNPTSTASGAYQMLDTTWRSEAKAAGQLVTVRAMDAPAAVQDAVAGFMATAAFNGPAAGDWGRVADVWYLGHIATPAELDVVPRGGNTITPRQYETQIAALMGAPAACVPSGPALASTGTLAGIWPQVLAFLEAQLGKPYLWGGTGPDRWDCSGLVQAAYASVGIHLPRTSEAQFAFTAGSGIRFDQAMPGALLFSEGIPPGHVRVYIGNGMAIAAPFTGAFVRIEKVDPGDLTGVTVP